MCEIAKAISHDAKVIIFDEPSAALTEAEIEELFKIIRDLRDRQLGIVYISHRMDEIKVITRPCDCYAGRRVRRNADHEGEHEGRYHQHDGRTCDL